MIQFVIKEDNRLEVKTNGASAAEMRSHMDTLQELADHARNPERRSELIRKVNALHFLLRTMYEEDPKNKPMIEYR